MRVLSGLLLGLVLAATAAHSHDEVVLPELPVPVIERIFPEEPIYEKEEVFRWAQNPEVGIVGASFNGELWYYYDWLLVELLEGQFGQVSELLAGIQEDMYVDESLCGPPSGDLRFDRFGLSLESDIRGGGSYDAFLKTVGGLYNRFQVVGGQWAGDTALRDTGLEMRFSLAFVDDLWCVGEHTTHSNGSLRHDLQHHRSSWHLGPYTAWIPIADLLDGTVTATSPEEPEVEEPAAPEEPAEPTAPTDNADALARLQSELDAARRDLSAVRDSVDALLEGSGTEIVTLYDTVEVATHDTLLYCPPSDDDRRDLFDLFTGANDDTTNSDGPAGKTASVQLESWGAIKSLIQE